MNRLSSSMDYEWRLEPQSPWLRECWAPDCGNLAVWDLTHYGGCYGGRGHHNHRSSHEHYCHDHAIERGLEPLNDPRIRRRRQHPWKLDEEVAA